MMWRRSSTALRAAVSASAQWTHRAAVRCRRSLCVRSAIARFHRRCRRSEERGPDRIGGALHMSSRFCNKLVREVLRGGRSLAFGHEVLHYLRQVRLTYPGEHRTSLRHRTFHLSPSFCLSAFLSFFHPFFLSIYLSLFGLVSR